MDTLCYDGAMNEICTCGESSPGMVIILHNTNEHHCSPPEPCWMDEPILHWSDEE